MKKTEIKMIAIDRLQMLKRNPQYLTPKQMENLKTSIERDGFCAPILVRPTGRIGWYEVVSGNHRFMSAQELKLTKIPCVVSKMSDVEAKRLAINLNTIHGDPNVELLAPFLAEMDEDLLREIYVDDDMKKALIAFDTDLAKMLCKLETPGFANQNSPTHENKKCTCRDCGRVHFRKEADGVHV